MTFHLQIMREVSFEGAQPTLSLPPTAQVSFDIKSSFDECKYLGSDKLKVRLRASDRNRQ